MARGDDLVDEGWPVVWPFLLEYGNKDEVELVDESLLLLQRLFGGGTLDDEVDDEIADSWATSALRVPALE